MDTRKGNEREGWVIVHPDSRTEARPGAKAWRLCPGEGLGLLNHLVDEVICFRPFEGLSGTDSGPQSEGQPHAAFSGFKMSMSSHHHIGTLP